MRSLKRRSIPSRRLRAAVILVVVATATMFAGTITAQKRKPARRGAVCGNPMVACKTSVKFSANDLPFRIPANGTIYDTDPFYAVMLKSLTVKDDNCKTFIPESDRLAAQALFPANKVFASRCTEPGEMFYTNTSGDARFMAVYAGTSLADANRMLALVKATGKFPQANIRRMRAGFNGT